MKTKFDNQTKWNPMGAMLLLVPTVEDEKSAGGLYIPETARRKGSSGFIAKMGPDVPKGLFNLGDEVFFEKHQEYILKIDDIQEEAFLISYTAVLLLKGRETSQIPPAPGKIGGGGAPLDIPPPGFVAPDAPPYTQQREQTTRPVYLDLGDPLPGATNIQTNPGIVQ